MAGAGDRGLRRARGEVAPRIDLDQGAPGVVGHGAAQARDLGLGQVGADMGEVGAHPSVVTRQRRHHARDQPAHEPHPRRVGKRQRQRHHCAQAEIDQVLAKASVGGQAALGHGRTGLGLLAASRTARRKT